MRPRIAVLTGVTLALATVCWLASAALAPRPANATVSWPTIGLKLVTKGLAKPNWVTSPPDMSGRLFVLEQAGKVRVIKNGVLLAKAYLDLSGQVRSTLVEQGMLGLAFAPDFSKSGRFFISFTGRDGNTHLVRFIVNPNADSVPPTSERDVLIIQRSGPNHTVHYGGCLQFGPDRMLYMSSGDSGPAYDASGNAQNPGVLTGKMLRLDVLAVGASPSGRPAYRIPAGNPFPKRAGWRPEIWQLGLRNPWRFSFDRLTGDMYVADVGQDRYEEIDVAPNGTKGQNFGWVRWEGDHPTFASHVYSRVGYAFPVAEFPHPELNLPGPSMDAVIGGYMYRGATSPKLRAVYYFADWVHGDIWGLKRTASGYWATPLLHTSHGWSSLGQDRSGEMLYLTDGVEGSVYRLMQR
jgi:glucose/arabinose dehydrogenase